MSKRQQTTPLTWKQRVTEAMMQLPAVREEVGFERLCIKVLQDGQHWQFRFGRRVLVQYWPGLATAETFDRPGRVRCSSAVHAGKLAGTTKMRLLDMVARVLRPAAAPVGSA